MGHLEFKESAQGGGSFSEPAEQLARLPDQVKTKTKVFRCPHVTLVTYFKVNNVALNDSMIPRIASTWRICESVPITWTLHSRHSDGRLSGIRRIHVTAGKEVCIQWRNIDLGFPSTTVTTGNWSRSSERVKLRLPFCSSSPVPRIAASLPLSQAEQKNCSSTATRTIRMNRSVFEAGWTFQKCHCFYFCWSWTPGDICPEFVKERNKNSGLLSQKESEYFEFLGRTQSF